jgi:hypothetical protein
MPSRGKFPRSWGSPGQTHTGIKPERVLEDGTTEPLTFT